MYCNCYEIRLNVLGRPNDRMYETNLPGCQNGFTELLQKTTTSRGRVATLPRMASAHEYDHETVSQSDTLVMLCFRRLKKNTNLCTTIGISSYWRASSLK